MIKQHIFGNEAAKYIRSRLAGGFELSKLLLDVPLEDGEIVAFLPASIDPARSDDFAHAIVPMDVARSVSVNGMTITPSGRHPIAIAIRNELTDMIVSFLLGRAGRCVVFEDGTSKVGDEWLMRENPQYFSYEQVVYHFLLPKDANEASVRNTIAHARSWMFLGVMATCTEINDAPSGVAVPHSLLRSLRAGIEGLVVGAFDNDSDLIWRERP